jgi:hypothetical protein
MIRELEKERDATAQAQETAFVQRDADGAVSAPGLRASRHAFARTNPAGRIRFQETKQARRLRRKFPKRFMAVPFGQSSNCL